MHSTLNARIAFRLFVFLREQAFGATTRLILIAFCITDELVH